MTISIDDRQLVESYQAGDTHAFADLVAAHSPSLLGHAIRRLGDRAAAEDAVQETFVRAFRALARFDGDYRVGPWLHRILVNVCNDEGNRRRRESEKFDRFAADPFSIDVAPGVEDELGLDFDDARINTAIESLPSSYREALNLRFVQELPYEEVARVAGVSEQNARARVSRARTAARSALRGVAAIPALLIPALRRGESVAAAAGHNTAVSGGTAVNVAGHAAPAFGPVTDAAMAAAPAVTPLLTKAVVGISLVAAMAAPTVGTDLVDRGRAVGEASVVVDEPVPATTEAVAERPATTISDVTPSTVVQQRSRGTADASSTSGGTDTATTPSTAPPVALPANPGGSNGSEAPGTDGPIVVPPPITIAGGSISITSVQAFDIGGGNLSVSGQATLDVDGRVFSGVIAGQLSTTVDEATGVRTYDGLLIMPVGNGRSVDLRLELTGTPIPEAADSPDTNAVGEGSDDEGEVSEQPTVEPTRFELIGRFSASSPESVSLVPSGAATGTLDLAIANLVLQLAG